MIQILKLHLQEKSFVVQTRCAYNNIICFKRNTSST